MIDNLRILEEVTRTSIALLLKEPYYAHIFSALSKEIVSPEHHLKTLAVGLVNSSPVLYVNSHFWDNFLVEKEYRYGVVKHEVLHIIFKHLLVDTKGKDQRLVNIAMDLVVNQYILRSNLPEESIFLETFPELNLKAEETWNYYYKALLKLQQNQNEEFNGTKALENLNNISSGSHGLDRHELWIEADKMDSVAKSVTESIIDNLVILAHQKTPSSAFGSMPGRMKALIEGIVIKPKPMVDWRRVVKLFSESSARTKVKNTTKRISKRFGTVPGIKIKKLKKLLVAVDTSGSVGKEELQDFFSEIYHIWRQGAEIEVVECDTTIQKQYTYKGITPQFVHGRGGTDFNAPIIYGNQKFLPDGLIYFTDGYAPIPTTRARFPILWVISRGGLAADNKNFKALPGRKAKLHHH